MKKHIRNGGKSLADMSSDLFEQSAYPVGRLAYSNRESPRTKPPPHKRHTHQGNGGNALNNTLTHPPTKQLDFPPNPKNRRYLDSIQNAPNIPIAPKHKCSYLPFCSNLSQEIRKHRRWPEKRGR